MKIIMILAFMFINGTSACTKADEKIIGGETATIQNGKIKIQVNSQTFTSTLLDNKTAKAFKEMLPLTIKMVELNANEKYYDLSKSLPTNPLNPRTIQNGDLMLYGSNTLVLFYKSFSTSYSYTKLGSIDDINGLAAALGSENVTVTFSLG